jgi:hypothetical protein
MKVTTASALVAAVAIAIPAQANAGSFMGVVLAKQSHRHALVLARASGAGLTVRTSARARLGDRLEVRGLRLRDGTVRVARLNVRSHTRHAVFRGVVVRQLRRSTLVSTGGSVIRIHHATRDDLRTGEIARFRVRIDDNELVEQAAQPLAQAANVEIEGRVVSVSPLVISLEGLPITITVPPGMTLPAALSPGEEIELIVSVGAANVFTLVAIEEIENENQIENEQEVEVKGFVASSTATQLVVQSNGKTFTFAAAAGTTLPILPVGTFVEARGLVVKGVLTLERVKIEDDDGDGGGDGHGGH